MKINKKINKWLKKKKLIPSVVFFSLLILIRLYFPEADLYITIGVPGLIAGLSFIIIMALCGTS